MQKTEFVSLQIIIFFIEILNCMIFLFYSCVDYTPSYILSNHCFSMFSKDSGEQLYTKVNVSTALSTMLILSFFHGHLIKVFSRAAALFHCRRHLIHLSCLRNASWLDLKGNNIIAWFFKPPLGHWWRAPLFSLSRDRSLLVPLSGDVCVCGTFNKIPIGGGQ